MPSRLLDAGELLWLTDHTPHEAVPNETGEAYYRQFFYLTTGVGVWYSQHNTANPLGIKPDAEISDANKFELLGAPHPPPARIQAHVAQSGKALLRASLESRPPLRPSPPPPPPPLPSHVIGSTKTIWVPSIDAPVFVPGQAWGVVT